MSALRTSTSVDTGESISAWRTIARGIDLSPELKEGFWGTLLFAVLATLGRVVVPIAVQQTLDRGLGAPGGPDTAFMTAMVIAAARSRCGMVTTSRSPAVSMVSVHAAAHGRACSRCA